MRKGLRRGLAGALCLCMSFSALTGCTKKGKTDTTAAMLTLKDSGTVSIGAAEVYLRYQQAEFENGFGQFIKSYYGDLWNADLSGTGEAYGNTFKEQTLTTLQHMLLAQAHADDFGVALTSEEEQAIDDAAESFWTPTALRCWRRSAAQRRASPRCSLSIRC